MLVDVHAHLDLYEQGEIDEVIKRAKKNNVKYILTSGLNIETNKISLELSKKYNIVYSSLGIYPPDALQRETKEKKEFNLNQELEFIKKNKNNFLSIGEIGLDYLNNPNKELQKKVFNEILSLAEKLNKPVIIHSRKAEKDCIDILENFKLKKIIMHCFNGNFKLVKKIQDNKWFFSIPTNIVRLLHFQHIVKQIPLEQLLTETDSPFLSPYKEKRNEPGFIVETIKKISEIKNLSKKETENKIYSNFQKIFLEN
ncbi:MAG: TatD family hydrolase [Nanoarchaeota archaeon]|nr:TatD family hydrolase [Nanoarchaeota archaeon]